MRLREDQLTDYVKYVLIVTRLQCNVDEVLKYIVSLDQAELKKLGQQTFASLDFHDIRYVSPTATVVGKLYVRLFEPVLKSEIPGISKSLKITKSICRNDMSYSIIFKRSIIGLKL
jgi:hypothetical protein